MFIYIIAFSYHVGYSDEERGGGAGGAVWSDIDFYRLEVRNPKARGWAKLNTFSLFLFFFLSLSLSSFSSAPHACWAKIRPLSLPEIEWLLLSANRRAAFVNRARSLLAVWYDKQTVNGDGGSAVISRSQEHFLSHSAPPLPPTMDSTHPPPPDVFFYPIFLEVCDIPLTLFISSPRWLTIHFLLKLLQDVV